LCDVDSHCRTEHIVGNSAITPDAAVQAFRTRCDQAVAQDAATQAYVRQLEQAYDATGEAAPRLHGDDAFNPEQLMHELEDFLRQERDRDAE
jgi:hypothetical protein